jgi:hypothetical protein
MNRAFAAVLVSLVTGTGAIWAAVPVHETRPVSPDGLVEVKMISGTLRVTGAEGSEVEVTGDLDDDRLKLEVTGSRDHVTIEVKYPERGRGNYGSPDLEVRIPRRCRLEAHTVSAPIAVSDLAARVDLNSVSGRLEVRGSPTATKLSTVSGEIVIEDGATLEDAEVNTVSGPIRASLRFRSGGSFSFDSVSGSIDLRLPAGAGADFDVSTFSGSISSDFGENPKRTSSILPSQELRFSTGSGGARVRAHSFSGSVRIRKD